MRRHSRCVGLQRTEFIGYYVPSLAGAARCVGQSKMLSALLARSQPSCANANEPSRCGSITKQKTRSGEFAEQAMSDPLLFRTTGRNSSMPQRVL
jgi:hypothetical protein